MREAADRDVVDPGLGEGGRVFERDAAGCLDDGAAGDALDGAADGRGIHVVEQDDVGAAFERFVHLIQVRHFDLDACRVRRGGSCAADDLRKVHGAALARGRDVVVFDEHAG
mgnify:CR=1 FL=1